ncbi:unnamed protein product [Ascophyllum nodosum]
MSGSSRSDSWSIASVEVVGAVHTSFTFNSLADAQFVSCRPRDVRAEDKIDELITAAAARTEPMELVPQSFLPSFPRVSDESRAEKILRKEKKQNEAVKLERGELLVYHRFGEDVKHRTKKGAAIMKEARAIEHLQQELDAKWGTGKKSDPGRPNRPSRLRLGISGYNEVKEQELMLVLKMIKIYESKPMYLMSELHSFFSREASWPVRHIVPVLAYHCCNGPWRSRWVRFGYCPEDHPVDRFEQMFEFRLSPGQLREWRETLKKIEALAPKKKTARDRTKTTTTNSRAKVNDGRNGDDDDMEEKEMDEGSRRDRGDREKELGGDNGDSAGGAKDEERRPGGDVDDAAVAAAVAAVDALQRSGEVDAEKSGKSTESKSRPSAPSGPSDGPAGEEGVARKRGDGGPGSGRGGGPDVLRSGGVTPEVVLAAKTKGRFASQVVVNGHPLTARNRQIVHESPFRTVQEVALRSSRLDQPNSLTGWWPQATIDKMRHLTLEGIHETIRLKQRRAKSAAAAAAAAAAADAATGGPVRDRYHLPKNLSTEEFFRAASLGEDKVSIVKAPPPYVAAADEERGGPVFPRRIDIPYQGNQQEPCPAEGRGSFQKDVVRKPGAEGDPEAVTGDGDRETVSSSEVDEEGVSDGLNSSDLMHDTGDDLFSEEPSDGEDDSQSDTEKKGVEGDGGDKPSMLYGGV